MNFKIERKNYIIEPKGGSRCYFALRDALPNTTGANDALTACYEGNATESSHQHASGLDMLLSAPAGRVSVTFSYIKLFVFGADLYIMWLKLSFLLGRGERDLHALR